MILCLRQNQRLLLVSRSLRSPVSECSKSQGIWDDCDEGVGDVKWSKSESDGRFVGSIHKLSGAVWSSGYTSSSEMSDRARSSSEIVSKEGGMEEIEDDEENERGNMNMDWHAKRRKKEKQVGLSAYFVKSQHANEENHMSEGERREEKRHSISQWKTQHSRLITQCKSTECARTASTGCPRGLDTGSSPQCWGWGGPGKSEGRSGGMRNKEFSIWLLSMCF